MKTHKVAIIVLFIGQYKGYNITPKNNISYDGVRVNKMIIVKPSMIEKVLKRKIIRNKIKIHQKSNRLIKIIYKKIMQKM